MKPDITITEAHTFVKGLYHRESRARRWFGTPLNLLVEICGGDIFVRQVTVDHVLAWENLISTTRTRPGRNNGRRLSPHTQDSYKRALRAFFNHLIAHKYMEHNPMNNNVSFPSVTYNEPKHLTPAQVQRLVDVSSSDKRSHALIQVFRASGVRLSGVAGLRLGDAIARGNPEREALYGLFGAVMFATIYREASLLHKGCVPSHLNNDVIESMVSGLQCMRALGAF